MIDTNPTTTTPIWYPSCAFITASCHLAWGALIVLFFSLLWGLSWGVGILLAFAAPKEFIFDLLVEGDALKGSATDFACYCVGAAFGSLLFFLAVLRVAT